MSKYMEGEEVSPEYAASELGFCSVAEMDRYYELMKDVQPKVAEALKRWFNSDSSQITHEVSGIAIMAMLKKK